MRRPSYALPATSSSIGGFGADFVADSSLVSFGFRSSAMRFLF